MNSSIYSQERNLKQVSFPCMACSFEYIVLDDSNAIYRPFSVCQHSRQVLHYQWSMCAREAHSALCRHRCQLGGHSVLVVQQFALYGKLVSPKRASELGRLHVGLEANAAYFLHCYVQNPWCFGHDRPASNDPAEQSDSAKSISLSKMIQQSNFQNLTTFSVFATELRNEKTKIFKEDENVEKNQKQEMNERNKRKNEK